MYRSLCRWYCKCTATVKRPKGRVVTLMAKVHWAGRYGQLNSTKTRGSPSNNNSHNCPGHEIWRKHFPYIKGWDEVSTRGCRQMIWLRVSVAEHCGHCYQQQLSLIYNSYRNFKCFLCLNLPRAQVQCSIYPFKYLEPNPADIWRWTGQVASSSQGWQPFTPIAKLE